ncbi:MAG: acetyl-CoA carboxylase biotin carboxyl carrier protein subunit, partial [Anaerolineales bacterium]
LKDQVVAAGDVLLILESMKMQNELKAPQDGVVTEVLVVEGDNVEKRDILVVIGPLEQGDNERD